MTWLEQVIPLGDLLFWMFRCRLLLSTCTVLELPHQGNQLSSMIITKLNLTVKLAYTAIINSGKRIWNMRVAIYEWRGRRQSVVSKVCGSSTAQSRTFARPTPPSFVSICRSLFYAQIRVAEKTVRDCACLLQLSPPELVSSPFPQSTLRWRSPSSTPSKGNTSTSAESDERTHTSTTREDTRERAF